MKKFTFYTIAILLPFVLVAQQGFNSIVNLDPVPVSTNTGEKPQAKVWFHAGKHWAVLPNSSGTHLWRLDGTTWVNVLRLSSRISSKADCKMVGNAAHILLFQGASSQLVSVEYSEDVGSYRLWSKRTSTVGLNLKTSTETATIDIDVSDRMWLAYDGTSDINVIWSDSPYQKWSSPITLANSVNSDDICGVISLPGKVGVFWSDQNSKRFGFRTHTIGESPATWSADEVPASQSAQNYGAGMADDHLNFSVESDGTLYCAVKTGYDNVEYPTIALLVRRPSGIWDDLYHVSGRGTRPIVLLNEEHKKVRVIYPEQNGGGIIFFRESSTSNISFGDEFELINGVNNNPTSTKNNFSSEVVVLASNNTHAVGVLALEGKVVPELDPPLLSSPTDLQNNVSTEPILTWESSTGAEKYDIEISENENFTTIGWKRNEIAGTSVLVSGLLHSTPYYWRVKALAGEDQSNWSSTWRFTTSVNPGSTLIAHWKMEDSSSTIMADATSYQNHGSLIGNPSWVAGMDGQAIKFNGSNEYATVEDNNSIDLTKAITIAMWVRPERQATQYLIKKAAHNSIDGYELALSNPGNIFFRFNQYSSRDIYRLNSKFVYLSNGETWIHIAATYDGSTMKLFINGVEDNSVTFSSSPSIAINNLPLSLGAESDGYRGVQGAMDDVRIYNTALNFSEIYDLANPVYTPPVAGIPLLLKPEDLSGEVETSPTLFWSPVEGVETYSVQISESSDFLNPVLDKTGILETSVPVTSLAEATSYYWRVRGVNSNSNSAWSEVWRFTTTNSSPAEVSAPVLISPENEAINPGLEINLHWSPSTGAEKYEVEISESQNFTTIVSKQIIAAASLLVSGLMNNTTYYWRVKAFAGENQSIWSSTWRFTTSLNSSSTLIAHWKLEESSNTTMVDATNYQNHGSFIGNPASVAGMDGQAIRFNGSNQYATVEDNNSIDLTKAITIAMWIKPERQATQYLIKKAAHNSVDGYELALSNAGNVFFRFNQYSSRDTYRVNSKIKYPSNGGTWMHIAATYDGSSIKLYIHGIEDNSVIFSSAPSIAINSLPFSLGAESDGYRGVQGAMDDVRIYNTALNHAEIYDLATEASGILLTSKVVKSSAIEEWGQSVELDNFRENFYVYPNPSSLSSTIYFSFSQDVEFSLTMYDLKGAKLKELARGIATARKSYNYDVDGSRLPEGIFLLKLQNSAGQEKTIRLLSRK